MLYILKFGGSSLSSVEKIKKVALFIKQKLNRSDLKLIVVVSAMNKTTNHLEKLAKEFNNKNIAYGSLITSGEIISASLLSLALEQLDIESTIMNAQDIAIHAKGHPANAIITHINTQSIIDQLSKVPVVIVPGFQGVNSEGKIVALGRGGSDTTAVALGATLHAPVKIYTDVNGIFVANPMLFDNVIKNKQINIENAIEQSYAGAKVLDKRSLEIANKYKVNTCVSESMQDNGTQIVFNNLEGFYISGISFLTNTYLIKLDKHTKNNIQIEPENILFECNIKSGRNIEQLILTNRVPHTHSLNENNNIKKCQYVVITGGGFNSYKEFKSGLNSVFSALKIQPIYLQIDATIAKIVVSSKAFKIVNQLLDLFNLRGKK